MFDYEKICNEVEDYLCGRSEDYDMPAIMGALMDYKPGNGDCITSIDDVDPDDFTEMLIECEK